MAQDKRLWYIVQTYSNNENSVKQNLEQRVKSFGMEDLIFDVVIPEETVLEKKADGTTKEKSVKIFPGYIFIEMVDNDETWFVVRNTPGVTGFLGSAGKKTRPVPVPKEEMIPILKKCGLIQPTVVNVQVGETVKILSGPFVDKIGIVDAIDQEKLKVMVLVEMFGRQTPVEIDFEEIEKM